MKTGAGRAPKGAEVPAGGGGTGTWVVLSTVGTAAQAEEIARALVGERLAACVNVVPGLRSTYRWKGDVLTDEETLLVMKTTAVRYPALERRLRELHPYECPEVLALEAADGFGAYLAWVGGSCEPARTTEEP